MPSYIHYTTYCKGCNKYLTKKVNYCQKCGNELSPINKWYVTFRAVEFGKYKQKKLGAYLSKREAEEAYIGFMGVKKQYENSAMLTFSEACDEVLLQIKAECKTSSYFDYKNIFENRFKSLRHLRIVDITKITLLNFRKSLSNSNYAKNTIFKTWANVGRILRYASLEYDIDKPYKDYQRIKGFSRDKVKKESWTVDDWQKFKSTVYARFEASKKECEQNRRLWTSDNAARENYTYYVLFSYLFYMANRLGEALALKPNKIDFCAHTVTIDESVTTKVTPEARAKGEVYAITDRKTHTALIEDIPENLEKLLKEYIEFLKIKPNEYLFFKNRPIPFQTLRRKMDEYIKLANVKRITPHQFRHTHASLIFSSGSSKTEDAYIVAHRLGHSVKYSLDTYGELYAEREKEIIKNLNFG